jgi:hypothetical protein
MKFLAVFLVLLLNITNVQSHSRCQEYLRLHQQTECSDNHYLKKFAYKYCLRYEQRKMKFTLQGQLWIENVKQCLLTSVIHSSHQNSCKKIAQSAYEKHAHCYIRYGYCNLPYSDKRAVFYTVWDSLYKIKTLVSAFRVQKHCLNSSLY